MRGIGIALIVAALVVGVGGIASGVSSFANLDVRPVDESETIEAEAGQELAMYASMTRGAPGSCSVLGPDGQPLQAAAPLGSEQISANGDTWAVVHILTVATSGAQTITCDSDGFAIGPRVGVFGLVAKFLVGIFGGFVLGVTGLVLLIVGRRRERRATTSGTGPGPQGPAQPGTYQDPFGAAPSPSGPAPSGYAPAPTAAPPPQPSPLG